MFSFVRQHPDLPHSELVAEANRRAEIYSYDTFDFRDYKPIELDAYEKAHIRQQQIPLKRIDPYLLTVAMKEKKPYSDHVIDLDSLLKSYIKLRAKNHPDKGGSAEVFVRITDAIQTIHEIRQQKNLDKPHDRLRGQFQNDVDSQYGCYGGIPPPTPGLNDGNAPITHSKFNQYFDSHRYVEEDTEFGYGDRMEQSRQKREDIYVDNTVGRYAPSTFQDAFERHKRELMEQQKADQKCLIPCIPEAYNDLQGTDGFRFITKPNNCYTAPSRYTDYWDAFHKPNIDVQPYLIIPDQRSLKKRLRDRKKESLEMTEAQREAYDMYLQQKQEEEEKELEFKQRVDQSIEHYGNEQYGKLLQFMSGR